MNARFWAILVLALAPMSASTASAEERAATLTAAQALALEESYRKAGRDKDADALLEALIHDRDPQIRAEARFRLGRARMARGDVDGAINEYSKLLEEQPDAQPVRLALARALAMQGRTGEAARELRRAEAGGLPEDVQRLVDRFSDILRRTRPYGVSIELGIAPDTNINQATSSTTVEIGGFPLQLDESGKATSGVGLTGSLDAFATIPVSHGINLVNRAALAGSFYRRGEFNDIFVSASSGPEFKIGRVVARTAGTYTSRHIGGHLYARGWGGSLQLLAPLGKREQLGAIFSLSDMRYRISEQSGLQYSLSATYEEALSPRLYGRIELSAARVDAEAVAYANTSYGGAVSLSREAGPATVYVRGGYSRTDGDGPFVLFGGARADSRVDLAFGASWNRWSIGGLKPLVRVLHTVNSSPLDLYRFKRTRIELALTEQF